MGSLQAKKDKLISQLQSLGRVAVAFSAGVDSTYLLKAASEALGENVIAITGKAVAFPKRELREAGAFCRELGIRQAVVGIDQLAIDGFTGNPPERCYHCKKALFSAFLTEAAAQGFPCLIEGTNADDVHDYRPGMRALDELGIISPLKDADLTKDEIRALSREAGLPTWDKPSYACLATRIPCGDEITAEKLAMIERAEEALFDLGFRQVRVRAHDDLARIEIGGSEMAGMLNAQVMADVNRRLREIGFRHVTLDLGGYRMGSTNRLSEEV